MIDGVDSNYFAIVVILIISFFILSLRNNKKNIDKGKGDTESSTDYWGQSFSHKEDYLSTKITFVIFVLTLIYVMLTK